MNSAIEKKRDNVVKDVSKNEATASIDDAVTKVIATIPRMFKTIKHQARKADVTDHDLGETQIWVLYALTTGTQLTGELARRFNVTTPTITRMVDNLVERGYVERRPDSEDRRRIYLAPTEMGASVAQQNHEQFRASVTSFLSPLSGKQLADIVLACKHLQSLLPDEVYDYTGLCPARVMEEGMGGKQEGSGENSTDREDI